MNPTHFPPEVIERLGFYVYAYIDPRNEEIFYVGKGTGNRAFSHFEDTAETRKTQRIAEIRNAGRLPDVDILVYDLTESEALRVEAVCIDLIGLDRLTNLVTGHQASWGGRQPARELIAEFAARPVKVEEPAIAININQTYRYRMSAEDLYDATRGIWRLNKLRAERARLALAVSHGVVKEVYEIAEWYPAGTTEYSRREFRPESLKNRFEFVGRVAAPQFRDKYLGGRIQSATSSQNPIRYLNC